MLAGNQSGSNHKAIHVLAAAILLLVPLLSASGTRVRAAPADTDVGGPITSDTTWTLAGSPYIVIANVQVTTGVTLTVEAGVVVRFNAGTRLQVDGTLIARGTADNPITFTSNQASPAKGDWKNIVFTDSSVDATFDAAGNYTGGSILEYCVVEYGGNGVEGAVQTDQASPLIDHCTVRNNGSSGIYAVGTSSMPAVISNSTVSDNTAIGDHSIYGGGIYVSYGTVTDSTVGGNSSFGSGGGIFAWRSTIASNNVSGNSTDGFSVSFAYGGGIYAVDSTVTGNTVSSNSATGGRNSSGGGICVVGSTVTDNTVSSNSAGGFINYGGGIYAYDSTVTGNTVSSNLATGEYDSSGGGIYAWGSTITGNTVSGNSTGSGGGIYANESTVVGNTVIGNLANQYGGGIYASFSSPVTGNTVSRNSASFEGGGIYAVSSPVINNSLTANNLSMATGQGSGVFFTGSADFLYNTIVGNTTNSPTAVIGGVAIEGTPRFQHNNLYGNANYDVVVLSSGDITSTENFWGTVAAADIEAHIHGHLLYVPYLQDPDPDAPVPPPLNLRADLIGDAIQLSWDAIPSTTADYGYKVYYDAASGPPYQGAGAAEGDSPIHVGRATHFTLSGLGNDGIYVAVTAYDAQGRESWYSNEAVSLWRVYLPSVRAHAQ